MTAAGTRIGTALASLVVAVGIALGAAVAEPSLVTAGACALVSNVVAWIVVRHAPRSPVAPALAWSSAAIVLVVIDDTIAASAATPSPLPLSAVSVHLWSGLWPVNLAGVLWLLLVFPDGARPLALVRISLCCFGAAVVAIVIGLWDVPQIDGGLAPISPVGEWLSAVGSLLVGTSLVTAVVAFVLRTRSGGERTRLQARWLVLAGVTVVALLVAGWVAQGLGARLELAYTPFLVAIMTAVPAAVGVAVVRHDLFDVDRVLGSTVSWALTAVLAAAAYAGVVLVVAQTVQTTTALSSGIAAFVAAILLAPAHRLVRAAIGRMLDRDRYVAVRDVERFVADVRAGRREPEEVEAVMRTAQGDDALELALEADGAWVRVDGTPSLDRPGAHAVDVDAGGATVARVALGRNSARARRRVADLVTAAALPIEVTRLRLALRRALDETRTSRERLARVGADERRRLERDLHDGAQQRILATGMRLRLLQSQVGDAHATELAAAVAELQATVTELRALAHGVRPSRLDDGLGAALMSLRAQAPLPIDLRVDAPESLDDARALAAYLVVSEAVANALKHAGARRIAVDVGERDGRLDVRITDDGVGLPPGAMLRALHDRAESVGGSLTVGAAPDGGTIVQAVI